MIDFLIRILREKNKKAKNTTERKLYTFVGSIIGFFLNFLLFVVKLSVGLLTGSIAVISDSMNNLSDMGVNVINFIGFRWSAKPADKNHPYGHGRMEYVLGLIMAFVIMFVGVDFLRSSFDRILTPVPVTSSVLSIVMIFISMLIKLYLFLFYRKIGKRINSTSFKSASIDSLSDIAVTLTAFLSLLLSPYTNIPLDGIAGLIVSLLVLYAGFNVAKESLQPLLGDPPSADMVESLASILHAEPEILGVHDVLIHDYGPERRMASAHVEVNGTKDIMYIHDIIDHLEKKVLQKLHIPLTIHVDPITTLDESGNRIKKEMRETAKKISKDFTIHDFKIIKARGNISVFFELDVPPNFPMQDEEILKKMTFDIAPELKFYIRIERSYF